VEQQVKSLIEALLKSSDEDDAVAVKNILEQFENKGLQLDLNQEETTTWEELDDFQYATVRVDYLLKAGNFNITTYWAEFIGEYGGGSAGWWVTKLECESEHNVELILEIADIYVNSPDVPKPIVKSLEALLPSRP
jgi:hypothetical protein